MKARYSDDLKAQAIAAVKAGEPIAGAARNLKVPESTVRTWAKQAGADFAEIRGKKKADIVELIADCLSENLTTLAAISRFVAENPSWMRKQRADELANFYGVTADKAVRILEAQAAARPVQAPTE